MAQHVVRVMLHHRAAVTLLLLGSMVLNLLVIGRVDPPDPTKGELPLVARCQGGGPGCAEQPMIPPPAVGLPRFEAPPAAVFGALVQIDPAPPVTLQSQPPDSVDRPPALAAA